MEIIQESSFRDTMENQVIPYLEARMKAGSFEPVPNQPLYFEQYTADEPAGVLVLLHGFSEGVGKFRECVYYFLQAGYHVWLLQQREHGKSYRSTGDRDLVYVDNYQQLVQDLHAFVHNVVKKEEGTRGLPLYLFGHSMGGGVSARYLEEYPEDFEKAVLSSPMLEVSSGDIPQKVAVAYVKGMLLMNRGKQYLPGSQPFSGKEDFENSCSNSRERYLYWLEWQREHREDQMCVLAVATSLQFMKLTNDVTDEKNCRRVKAKVLLLQAGKDTMVKPGGQETFIRRIGSRGTLLRFPESKHEIYMERTEVLRSYWEEILEFLAE